MQHADLWTPHVVIAAGRARYACVSAGSPLVLRGELQGRLDLRIGDGTAAIAWRPAANVQRADGRGSRAT